MVFSRTDLIKAILFAQDNEEEEYSELLDIYNNSGDDGFKKSFFVANNSLISYIDAHAK